MTKEEKITKLTLYIVLLMIACITLGAMVVVIDFKYVDVAGILLVACLVGFIFIFLKKIQKVAMREIDTVMIENHEFPIDIYNDIINYMERGNKIRAIKEIKGHTGISLKETKALVERFSHVVKIPMCKGYGDKSDN